MAVTDAFAAGGRLRDPFIFISICLLLDLVLGDPQYALHPIRLAGRLLSSSESVLRRMGLHGRFGGVLLFLFLFFACGGFVFAVAFAIYGAARPVIGPAWSAVLEWIWEAYIGYSLLALGDLVRHGLRISRSVDRGDLPGARSAAAMLVGRDVDKMDFSACNRAAVESLAESLCDGVIAPLFWFVLLGLPGLLLFKVASTMDSMVGYRDERYLRFGWFGARLDDAMNWIPARLCVVLIAAVSAAVPGYSARLALRVARAQHALLPGPNKGWSETAAAGALGIRLAGPIWKNGNLVNKLWIGPPEGREGGSSRDVTRMITLAYAATVLFMGLAWLWLRTGWSVRPF
ncbi:MAG: adenosylcobinamide-phosphate synthase CbiB [Fibrobacteria bacterium]